MAVEEGAVEESKAEADAASSGWVDLGGVRTAWYPVESYTQAAEFVATITQELADGTAPWPDLDLRSTGVLAQVSDAATERAISDAARTSGLHPDAATPQRLGLVIEAFDPEGIDAFWRTALGYPDQPADPLRRLPPLRAQRRDDPRPLRDRIHLDVGLRDADGLVGALHALGGRSVLEHDYYTTVADGEGTEVDVVPGGDVPGAEDFQAPFAAYAYYPGATLEQIAELAAVVAQASEEAGFALPMGVRGSEIFLDSGKDRWEDDAFAPLASEVQAAARRLGLTAQHDRLRFIQFGLDALDLTVVREFWRAALGYRAVDHPHVTDIYDPHWIGPVLFFQPLDPRDTQRHGARGRLHLELTVPDGQVRARVHAATQAGGQVIADDGGARVVLADPEMNVLAITSA